MKRVYEYGDFTAGQRCFKNLYHLNHLKMFPNLFLSKELNNVSKWQPLLDIQNFKFFFEIFKT